ncbi:MAG: hypothetical protein ACOY3K_02285 [Candidatus Omnitrophota bacterium]
MTITNQILKPFVDRLFFEYRVLEQEVNFFNSPNTQEIKKIIARQVGALEKMVTEEFTQDRMFTEAEVTQLRDKIRKLKMDLRSLQRRWNRFQVTEGRFHRLQESKRWSHGFAA